MNILYLVIPSVTTTCAWATSRLMVWALFNPVTPATIAGIALHGVVPKLQQKPETIAAPIADAISNLIAQQGQNTNMAAVRPLIEQHLDTYLTVRLKEKLPVIASFIGPSTTVKLKDSMIEEIDTLLPQVISSYVNNEFSREEIEEKIGAAVKNISTDSLQKIATKQLLQNKLLLFTPIALGAFFGLVADILCYVLIQ